MIQMYLHENSIYWKLLEDQEFLSLRNVVDNTMKETHSAGMGVRKSSEIISLDNENQMFEKGILGDDSPEKLLKTVIYMLGLHCALCGGVEHSNLRRPGFNEQIKIEVDGGGVEHLVYTEDPLQKTNQGGLNVKKFNKIVKFFPSSNKMKCPVYIYKKYVGLLPRSSVCKKFYLRCKKKPTPSLWFCDQPYGINKIKNTVKDICSQAGIVGKFTNHSLRATCESRMYAQNIPEQLIKEVTGHRCECVRTYKRTPDALKKVASNTAHCDGGVKSIDEGGADEKVDEKGILSVSQMIANVRKTKFEIRQREKPKSKLRLKRDRKSGRFMIDLNFNMKVKNSKKEK